MSNFYSAIDGLLKDEGGYVDDPNDAGGATKFGISLNFLLSIKPGANKEDIKNLTVPQAQAIYKEHFWEKYNIEKIENQRIANTVFELFVNMSPSSATKVIQNAVNSYYKAHALSDCLNVDGVFGKETLTKLLIAAGNDNFRANLFMMFLKEAQIKHYVDICMKDKTQSKFLLGWIRRALNG